MTMTNQELTERCAKLIGVFELGVWDDELGAMWDGEDWSFAPLLDDGDAFRLRNKLRMGVFYTDQGVNVAYDDVLQAFEDWGANDLATERLAITRAAAQIHKDMEKQNG